MRAQRVRGLPSLAPGGEGQTSSLTDTRGLAQSSPSTALSGRDTCHLPAPPTACGTRGALACILSLILKHPISAAPCPGEKQTGQGPGTAGGRPLTPQPGARTLSSTHAIHTDRQAALTVPPRDRPPPAHLDGAVVELLGPHLRDAELKAVELWLVSGVRTIYGRRIGFTAS